MDLIQKINKSHGLSEGEIDAHRSDDDPVVILRGKLERACQRLSTDLYNSQSHFILEFVQNADDNHYAAKAVPTLRLCLKNDEVVIECNEKGFDEANVKAICDIGASTKATAKKAEGYIGEKGIGFKAVFVVAHQVHVASGPFTFRFDRDACLGMVNPIWDVSHRSNPGWTTFRLAIAPTVNRSDLEEQIRGIRPTLLLFLRKLRSIDIEINMRKRTRISVRRVDEPDNVIKLERYEKGVCVSSQKYLVFRRTVRTYAGEEKRQGIQQSEVVLAFPIDASSRPVIGQQYVHAFLPVATYGLPFVAQADFLTSASREDILADPQWNLVLLDGVRDTFLAAVEQFKQHPSLRDCWMRYIPMNARGPFRRVEEGIVKALKSQPVLRDMPYEQYRLPPRLVAIPDSFRSSGSDRLPLIAATFLPNSISYLSSSYDTAYDWSHLSTLGVEEMSEEHFLAGLQNMDQQDQFPNCSAEWFERVCQLLRPKVNKSFRSRISNLRLLPLADGTWARVSIAPECSFYTGFELSDVVGLRFVASSVRPFSSRYAFLEAMGVQAANEVVVAKKILDSMGTRTLLELVRFAQFFYTHRDDSHFPDPVNLDLMDEEEIRGKGRELYIDVQSNGVSLRDILPGARFIHTYFAPPYLFQTARWQEWLQDSLGLHIHPRVLGGRMSPEFKAMTQALSTSTPQLLGVLQNHWPYISEQLSAHGLNELSQITVACTDGTQHMLAGTALRRRSLTSLPHEALRFVEVLKADDRRWDFLQELGVMVEANAAAWLGVPEELRGADAPVRVDSVMEVYKQLDARFNEAPETIRQAFNDHSLILRMWESEGTQHTMWTDLSGAYWNGPSYLKDVTLKTSFPHLRDFFVNKLDIPDVPLRVTVDRLLELAQNFAEKALPSSVGDVIERILLDLTELCAKSPGDAILATQLKRIRDRAVFPAVMADGNRMLLSTGGFYTTRGGAFARPAQLLKGRVPLLSLSRLSLADIEPLLGSSVWVTPVKYLEPPLLDTSYTVEGDPEIEHEITERFTEPYRLECIRRTVCYNLGSQLRQRESPILKFADKLPSLKVSMVDAILEHVSLRRDEGDLTFDIPLDSRLEEPDDALVIFVARERRTKVESEIITQLSRRLRIDRCRIAMYMRGSREDIEDTLQDDGIELASTTEHPEDYDTYSFAQPRAQDTYTDSHVPISSGVRHDSQSTGGRRSRRQKGSSQTALQTVPSSTQSPPAAQTRAPLDGLEDAMNALEEQLADLSLSADAVYTADSLPSQLAEPTDYLATWHAHSPQARDEPPAGGSVRVRDRPQQLEDEEAEVDSEPESCFSTVTTMTSTAGSTAYAQPRTVTTAASAMASLVASLTSSTSVFGGNDEYQKVNGILGERYAYAVLRKILGPGFGPDNWTSGLRGEVPGFTHYDGPSVADFIYPDTHGILTALWRGGEVKDRWMDAWPTYHIEVKATSMSGGEPFHMSPTQLSTALHMTTRPEDLNSPPMNVYVILRVSGIRSDPKYAVFVDPHQLIYKGGLVINSEAWVSKPALA